MTNDYEKFIIIYDSSVLSVSACTTCSYFARSKVESQRGEKRFMLLSGALIFYASSRAIIGSGEACLLLLSFACFVYGSAIVWCIIY